MGVLGQFWAAQVERHLFGELGQLQQPDPDRAPGVARLHSGSVPVEQPREPVLPFGVVVPVGPVSGERDNLICQVGHVPHSGAGAGEVDIDQAYRQLIDEDQVVGGDIVMADHLHRVMGGASPGPGPVGGGRDVVKTAQQLGGSVQDRRAPDPAGQGVPGDLTLEKLQPFPPIGQHLVRFGYLVQPAAAAVGQQPVDRRGPGPGRAADLPAKARDLAHIPAAQLDLHAC